MAAHTTMLGAGLLLASVAVSLCPMAEAADHVPDLLPTVGSIERLDPRFDKLVPKDAVIEVLAGGFEWAEGPVWVADASGGHLLFSDIPVNTVFRWKKGEGIGVFLRPSGFTGAGEYGKERGSSRHARDSPTG